MKRLCLPLLTLLILACCAATLSADPVVRTLDNGARIIVEENHAAPVSAIRLYVDTGAVLEGRFVGTGISHLVEHCIGEGTLNRSADEIERIEQEMGNNRNAYTSKRVTCYYMTTTAPRTAQAIDLLVEQVLGATFPPEKVETQRGIILREMARDDDDPGRRVSNLYDETMYTVSPERYRIIGYEDQFKAITRDDLVAYARERYTPYGLVAVVVGDVDAKATLDQLAAAIGKYPPRASQRPALPTDPAPEAPRLRVVEQEGLQRAYLMMGFRSVNLFSPDMYPLDVASYILSNGANSRLVHELRDVQGLVDGIEAWSDTPDYINGSFVVSATLDPANLEKAEHAILQELAKLRETPVTAEELQRAKKQKEAELVFVRDTVAGRAEQLGSDLLVTGDIAFGQHYVDRIEKVTAQQVQEVAQRYIDPNHAVVCILRPPAAAGATGVRPPTEKSRVLQKTLANGVRVVVKADPGVPTVHLSVVGAGGLRCETPATSGVTNLMAHMLLRGTDTRSREQIANVFESTGGSVDAFSGRNSFGLNASVLPADAGSALEVIADCLQHPTFPASEFESLRKLTLAAIAAQDDDADNVSMRLLRETLYTVHPYRGDPLGTTDSVKAMTLEELRTYHSQVCQPGSLVVVALGSLDPEQTMTRIETLFGAWQPPKVAALPPPPVEPPVASVREKTVSRAQEQAITNYGFIGPRITGEDRFTLDVMSAVFAGAGMPGGRLYHALRNSQLVYATFGVPVPGIDPGFYDIYAATPPERVAEARTAIDGLIAGMRDQPVSADELARGKAMCIANFDIELAEPGSLAQSMALDVLYGLGTEEMEHYRPNVEAVTADQVQAEARKLLDLQHCAIVTTMPEAKPSE